MRRDVCIDQVLAQCYPYVQRAMHASGCYPNKPNPFLWLAATHCGCPCLYRQPPHLCPHSPNELVCFRVLAPSADQTDLVNCDMTTDADTRVSNQTAMSPLCPNCTAQTTRSTMVAHVLQLLPLVLQLLMSCPKVLYLVLLVLLLTIVTLLLMRRLLRQVHRKHPLKNNQSMSDLYSLFL